MQTLSEIRALLASRGLRPRRRFGQNFLHDQNLLRRLVDAAGIAPGDLVLEIGPGTGTLTEALLERGAEVVACEIDRDLAELVADRLGDRITLLRGDCLEKGRKLAADVRAALGDRPFRLVANLPYQVASPLMSALLIDHPGCLGQYVTIQREVADRLLAGPGTKAWGPLGVIVQALAEVERLANLPPTCFWPAPQVTSAMASIRPRATPATADPAAFAPFVVGLFGQRRKQLGSILGRDVVAAAGLDPEHRPERLTPEELERLRRAVAGA